MIFTKEQLDALYPAQIHFDSALHQAVIKNVPRWLTEKVIDIYRAATNKIVKINNGCGSCVMSLYKTVGKIYFQDLKELEELNAQPQPMMMNAETPAETPKKRGRRKKVEEE